MFAKLRPVGQHIKHELKVYRLVLKDHRTPKLAKVILWVAIGYTCLPFDVIPDFIPVIGYLDDIIIVPGLIIVALKLIPREVIEDCRGQVDSTRTDKSEGGSD
ncbi:MAG: DUF1232 domain-containing protein [Chloroflexota bacterium]